MAVTTSSPQLRVPHFLHQQRIQFEQVVHTPAFRAESRITVLDVLARHLAKSVLLEANNTYMLALVPATHHVNLRDLWPILGRTVRLARRDEMALVFRDCEWGASAPFGRLYGISTLLDCSFHADQPIVFEAHMHALSIRMNCCDYERLEQPKRLSFAHRVL